MRQVLNSNNAIILTMLVVGITAMFLSAQNTSNYLILTGFQTHMALLTGWMFILFSSTSFTAARLFMLQSGAIKAFAPIFVFIGMVVISLSVLATLSLNYVRFLNSDAMQLELNTRIEQRRSELLAEMTTETQATNQWLMDTLDRFVGLAEETQGGWSVSMGRIIEAAREMSYTQAQEIIEHIHVEVLPPNLFSFALNLRNTETRYIFDFLMLAGFAALYDILAPLSITLFLIGFVKKEEPARPKQLTRKPIERMQQSEKQPEVKPDIKEVIVYIESALQDDFSLLPDDEIGNIEERQCKKFREYLSSFFYKDSPIITENEGRFVSMFDRTNLKKFIELQHNVRRKE